jgi:AAA domain
MIRQTIAGFLQSRQFYERARPHLETIKDPMMLQVVAAIDGYYSTDTFANACDAAIISQRVCLSIPNAKKHDEVAELVTGLADESIPSLKNLEALVESVRKNALRLKLRDECAAGTNDDAINAIISDWQSLQSRTASEVRTIGDPKQLFHKLHHQGLLIGPPQMRAALKYGLKRGHHTLLVARSNIGKTALGVSLACDMLRQGLRGLWIENEEDTEITEGRFFCNLCDVGEDDLQNFDITELDDEARRNGKDNMFFYNVAPGTLQEIDSIVRQVKPDFLIVNQIRHLSVRAENRTNQLEIASNGVRTIGKKHGLYAFSVTQGGATADGKQYLDEGDIDHSKTGIVSSVDLAIGVGATAEDVMNNIRHVSLFKNKPGRRQTVFACRFYPEVSRLGEAV